MTEPKIDRPHNHNGNVVDVVGNYSIIDCEVCGFCHAMPLPEEKDMADAYRADYYSVEKPLYLDYAVEDEAWFLTMYNDRYARFEALLGSDERRFIDIGSGPGLMLQAGAARGWDVLGIEPSRQAAEFSRGRGLTVIEDFFTDKMASSLAPANVVHLRNVLEHIADPQGFIASARKLVLPGGLICVSVPNDYNPLQKVLRDVDNYQPWWLAPPHHLNYFSFDSLELLLDKAGFTALERMTTFPMEAFLLMGDNYTGDPQLGRLCHSKRKSFDIKLDGDLRRRMYRALAAEGIGREAIVIARVR